MSLLVRVRGHAATRQRGHAAQSDAATRLDERIMNTVGRHRSDGRRREEEQLLLEDARAEIAAACQNLRRDSLVVGTAGNVSVRVDDLVAISPSGLDYADLTAELVGVHDLEGAVMEVALKPSSEIPLHLAVYARSDAAAVIHTHAPASSALSTVVDEVPSSHYYTAMFGGSRQGAAAPYATFGTPQLAEGVAAALRGRTAARWATTVPSLSVRHWLSPASGCPTWNTSARCTLRALSIVLPVRTLPPEECALVAEQLSSYGQRAPQN